MTDLAQELLELIIQQVEDTKTLKACSLASSCLTGSSQRILLRRLALRATGSGKDAEPRTNYIAASRLLRKSPHIIAYVTDLDIDNLPIVATDLELECFRQVINILHQVQRCNISKIRWAERVSGIDCILVDYLAGHNLSSLGIRGVEDIPLGVFLRLITSAPTLSFFSVHVAETNPPPPELPNPQSIDELILTGGLRAVISILCRPQFAAHISKLRRLRIPIVDGVGLIRAAGPTLEHISLDCSALPKNRSNKQAPFFGPPLALPSLRSVEMDMWLRPWNHFWFLETMTAVLASNTVQEITVIGASGFRTSLEPPLLATLDQFLATHRVVPCLQWRIIDKTYMQMTTRVIQRAMRQLHGMGKLVIQFGN
ncbi:hypothetical protein DFH09DRAFT_1187681 [Mycena vulgaris]|nr:hypothetical protein DFH09DRAFT_1187681 [Mycena vulgaris]